MSSVCSLCVLGVVASFLGCTIVDGGCPYSWMLYGENCYILIDRRSNWIDALSVCKAFGGYLVEITSRDENDHMKNYARSRGSSGGLWIGANDFMKHGEWRWANSGARIEDKFENWAGGQPDNPDYRCVQLWSDRNYEWDDYNCEEKQNFICERRFDYCFYCGL